MRLATIAAASMAFLAAAACKPSRPRSPRPRLRPGAEPQHGRLAQHRAHLPRPGMCRVWMPDEPPGHQPKPRSCSGIERTAPAGGYIVERPGKDKKVVHVRVMDERRRASSSACACTRSATASWSARADRSPILDYPGSAWVVCLPSSRLTGPSSPTTAPTACRGAIRRGPTAHATIRWSRLSAAGSSRRPSRCIRPAAEATEADSPSRRPARSRSSPTRPARAGSGRLHCRWTTWRAARSRNGTADDRRAESGARNCAEWRVGELRGAGQNPRAVSVVAGETVSETFAIVCTQPPPVTGG